MASGPEPSFSVMIGRSVPASSMAQPCGQQSLDGLDIGGRVELRHAGRA
jgi:hypothetical protein